jgi:hypothetical protein
LGAFFDYYEPNDGKMNEWCARTRLPENDERRLTEGDFKKLVAKKVTRRMIFRELQAFSPKYNRAARLSSHLGGQAYGEYLEQEDINNIVYLLGEEVGRNLQAEAVSGEEYLPLYNGEEDVIKMLGHAGLLTEGQLTLRLGTIMQKIGEKVWNQRYRMQ